MFALTAFLVVVLLSIAGAWILDFVFEARFGMSSTYRPSDHDRRLTSVAREAAPIIEAINRYRQAHGRCPAGGDWDELRETLPADLIMTRIGRADDNIEIEFRRPQSGPVWLYSARKPTTCGLWRKLGWDPSIRWERSAEGTRWIFDPGDGGDEVEVVLDIGS